MSHEEQPNIRQVDYKQPAGWVPTEATEVSGTQVQRVEGQTVIVIRAAAETVTAERVTLEQSAAKTIDAKSVQMEQAGAMLVTSSHAVLHNSGANAVIADEARLVRSQALLLKADQAHLEKSQALILAGRAEGDVRVGLTLPAAAAFGAALGVTLTIAWALLRRAASRRGERP